MSHAPTHVFPVHTNFYATCTCVSCALAPCHHVVYRPHHVRVLQSGRPVHFDLQPGLHGQAARQDHRGDAGRVSPCSSFSSSSVPFSSSLCSRDNLGETNSYCNFSFFFYKCLFSQCDKWTIQCASPYQCVVILFQQVIPERRQKETQKSPI